MTLLRTSARFLAAAVAAAGLAGCVAVPVDSAYYGHPGDYYASPAPYPTPYPVPYAGYSSVNIYSPPAVIYSAPPRGWSRDDWHEHQRRPAQAQRPDRRPGQEHAQRPQLEQRPQQRPQAERPRRAWQDDEQQRPQRWPGPSPRTPR